MNARNVQFLQKPVGNHRSFSNKVSGGKATSPMISSAATKSTQKYAMNQPRLVSKDAQKVTQVHYVRAAIPLGLSGMDNDTRYPSKKQIALNAAITAIKVFLLS